MINLSSILILSKNMRIKIRQLKALSKQYEKPANFTNLISSST